MVLYQTKKSSRKLRASGSDPKRSGNSGVYFSVLNWLSENGLSLETCGRLWVLVDPQVGEQEGHRLGDHRGPVIRMDRQLVLARSPAGHSVSAISRWARVADSRQAASQPTT